MLLLSRVLAISVIASTVGVSPAVAQLGAPALGALNSEDGGIVIGEPLALIEKTVTVTPVVSGATITRRVEIRKWRDSQGRFRRDTTQVQEGQPAVYRVAVIIDPVKNTVTTLNLDAKTALVVHLLTGQLHPYVDLMDMPLYANPGVQVKVEKLPEKTILGVPVVGRRVTRTRPPGTVGNDQTIVSTAERWVSPDLKIMLATSTNDPRELMTRTVTWLDRSEPDPTVFQIPGDYTMKESTAGRGRQVLVQP